MRLPPGLADFAATPQDNPNRTHHEPCGPGRQLDLDQLVSGLVGAEQIDLGICEDQSARQQRGQVPHDLDCDLRVKPAISAKASSGSSRHLTAVSAQTSALRAVDDCHLAELMPVSEASRTPLGNLTLDHAALQKEQGFGGLAGAEMRWPTS